MSRGVNQTGVAILRDNNGAPIAIMRSDGSIKFIPPVEFGAGVQYGGVGLGVVEFFSEVDLANADIIGTSALQFGHAAGYPLVAAQGADKYVEFISALLICDRGVAAYTAGGNITVNLSGGGAALSGLVSAANSLGAATDKVASLVPLAAAGAVGLTANLGLNIVSSAAFTDPGTAVGHLRVRTRYRVHTLGLA